MEEVEIFVGLQLSSSRTGKRVTVIDFEEGNRNWALIKFPDGSTDEYGIQELLETFEVL